MRSPSSAILSGVSRILRSAVIACCPEGCRQLLSSRKRSPSTQPFSVVKKRRAPPHIPGSRDEIHVLGDERLAVALVAEVARRPLPPTLHVAAAADEAADDHVPVAIAADEDLVEELAELALRGEGIRRLRVGGAGGAAHGPVALALDGAAGAVDALQHRRAADDVVVAGVAAEEMAEIGGHGPAAVGGMEVVLVAAVDVQGVVIHEADAHPPGAVDELRAQPDVTADERLPFAAAAR